MNREEKCSDSLSLSEGTEFSESISERAMSPWTAPQDTGWTRSFWLSAWEKRGAVHAFAIQVKAINELKEKFRENPQVTIHGESYVNLSRYISEARIIMYNLGYLPGGDCDLTTKTEETLRSLEQACQLVLPKGVISVVAYPGHPEGAREAVAVEEYLKALPGSVFEVLTLRQTNRSAKTPVQHFVFRNR